MPGPSDVPACSRRRLAALCVQVLGAASGGPRMRSLPTSVRNSGGIDQWNMKHADLKRLKVMLDGMCLATTVDEALEEVHAIMSLGRNFWAYAYMRTLYSKNLDLYYATLLAKPATLLPVVYTPTVGEACQKFGKLPFQRRGCYISLNDRGDIKSVLEEYAAAELTQGPDGRYLCDCIVFSDGGRILGLGDLGTWGMGIPIGKLDLYTACAGFNPHRTMPVIIDVGCSDAAGNSDKVVVRDHELYTGMKQDRKKHTSEAGTSVNSEYYGKDSLIGEFMQAAADVFGTKCLLQFEDFNSNDAFPLLAEYRDKFLTYNDDIQGTAAVAVAALMGAAKLRNPGCTDLVGELKKQTFLFHGAGSANIGTLKLLVDEAGVPRERLFVTNSRGVIWKSADGKDGSFRNDEQKEFAQVGKPDYDSTKLTTVLEQIKPISLVGAVGVAPGCFDKDVVNTMVRLNKEQRPSIFALSNPRDKAEITATDAYTWSNGAVIYGSGTAFEAVDVGGKTFAPGQVNNVYIFPGVSFGAICCQAKNIPERIFMVAAEAVANSLNDNDIKEDRIVPHPDRLREVGLNVATAVVLETQKLGLAGKTLGADHAAVRNTLASLMWSPSYSGDQE
mmetsp:Transcript_26412/g.75599  ORF Transcript_26412/g.75599 Transcript_26412/m.75599 type:complete len:615 (-) Transcript_26412:250-2094(-)